jgi:hypothetical protein
MTGQNMSGKHRRNPDTVGVTVGSQNAVGADRGSGTTRLILGLFYASENSVLCGTAPGGAMARGSDIPGRPRMDFHSREELT